MHIIAAKAVAFKEAQSFGFREYQRQIIRNAQALAKSLQEEGFRLVTGGTDNHLMLVDLREEGISGKEAADLLEQANIIVNKNTVPGDERPAWETSGIRPGTPALTTREMGEEQMQLIGKLMARVIRSGDDMFAINEVKDQVLALCEQFPIYVDLYD
jgi:glycine hydroxymethyltransferase